MKYVKSQLEKEIVEMMMSFTQLVFSGNSCQSEVQNVGKLASL